jgi:rfaE bifunctional protein nucleotidyltransferase chain/domain
MTPPLARSKVLPRKDLAGRSVELREAGKRLVLTNGCFDLLHLGHVRYLEAARRLGDALAVGVNTDASVRRLKGEGRPINPEQERAEVVAALAAVDWVVLFPEDTATELVRALSPAIYVKGGDYSDDPASEGFPVEGHEVMAHGGIVRIVELVPGWSTTDIIRRAMTPAGTGGYNAGS